ncbi:MAG: FkbM family methyltransferase [Actinomycetota bacterium]|nr:FkbM family methyltransferase [Actinomycetota bacterium]
MVNQCQLLIGYHFAPSYLPEENGEQWLLDRVGSAVEKFIDVGANVGDWTRMVLHRSPAALGVAVEPGTEALARLKERLPTTIEIVPAAAGRLDGSVITFYEEPEAGGRSSSVRDWGTSAKRREVKVVTIDALMDDLGWERVNLLKIDTEGYDASVMFGSANALKCQKIDLVQFEYNRPWREAGNTLGGVIRFLDDAGYDVFVLRPHGLDRYDYTMFGEFFSYSNFVALSRTSPLRELLDVP